MPNSTQSYEQLAYEQLEFERRGRLGLITLNVLAAADSVLIPLQCEYLALEGITQLMDTITLVRGSLNPNLEIEGVLLTMFDERTNLSCQVADEVRSVFGKQVYRTVIPRNIRLGEAPSHGQPIFLYDIRSRGAEAYLEFATEFADHETQSTGQGATQPDTGSSAEVGTGHEAGVAPGSGHRQDRPQPEAAPGELRHGETGGAGPVDHGAGHPPAGDREA